MLNAGYASVISVPSDDDEVGLIRPCVVFIPIDNAVNLALVCVLSVVAVVFVAFVDKVVG